MFGRKKNKERENKEKDKERKKRSSTSSIALKKNGENKNNTVQSIEEKSAKVLQRYFHRLYLANKWKRLYKQYSETEDAKKVRLRILRVKEIVSTEETYYNILRLVKIKYKDPILKSKIMPQVEAEALFGNWDMILNLSEELHAELERQLTRWPYYKLDIGHVFIKHAPFFRCYTEFVSNYSNSLEILTKLRAKRQINNWLKKVAEDNEAQFNGQELIGCLIVPVQRLPRYLLLLQDLLKSTPEEHVDYANIRSAIEQIRKSTEDVNKKVKQAEQLGKLYEIQSKLVGTNLPQLIKPHRRLIRADHLVLISENPQTYFVILFNDLILISATPRPNQIQVMKVISLFNTKAQILPQQPPVFVNAFILCGAVNYYFSAKSPAEQEKWVTDINTAFNGLSMFNHITDDMYNLMKTTKRVGRLLVKVGKGDWQKRRCYLNGTALDICTRKGTNKAREKLLTLNLPEYTLQLLSDKQANKKYCVELRNCVTDEYIWFAANDGDKFDKWVTILLPATYHPEEDDEEPEIPEAVPHSPIEKENATGTEVALRNKVDTLTSGEVVLRRNKTRTVTMSVRRPITGRFQDLVLNYEEGEAQCEDDSPKKPEQKTESEESLKRPELKHNPAPEISPPPSP